MNFHPDRLVAVTLRVPGRVTAEGADGTFTLETDHGTLTGIRPSWITEPCPPDLRPVSFSPARAMAQIIAARAAEGQATTEGDLLDQNFTPREVIHHLSAARELAAQPAAAA